MEMVALIVTLSLFFLGAFADFSGGAAAATTVYSSLSVLQEGTHNKLPTDPPRKSLRHGSITTNPNGRRTCGKSDIQISQGPTTPLPNGIPTYTVEISNECLNGCKISNIHVNCGKFSSASLINPKIFRRLRYNDCLVNDGKPLKFGGIISFKYANTFPYPLSVSRVACI